MTDEEIARAQALGRAAARAGQSITSCPYPSDGTADNRILRGRWAIAYARAGGRVGVEGALTRARKAVRRFLDTPI